MKAPATFLALLICIFAAGRVSAATLLVTKVQDTSDGICDADCSLREAIAAASPADSVTFSVFFQAPRVIVLTLGEIAINKRLTIIGTGSGLLSVSGNDASRIFNIQANGRVSLSGMTLRNGRFVSPNSSPGIGGGILLLDTTLTLTDVTLRNNFATSTAPQPTQLIGYGGAIYSRDSTLSLINSTIIDNYLPGWPHSGRGGGIYANGTTDVNIVDSVLRGNSEGALYSGRNVNVTNSWIDRNDGETAPGTGIGISGTSVTVLNSIVSNNNGTGVSATSGLFIERSTIENNGRGVYNTGTATIHHSRIANNRNLGLPGNVAGGVYNNGTLFILSSAIINNAAADRGGGIYNVLGSLYLTGCTVSGNFVGQFSGSHHGGGIYNSQGGHVVVTNSTISNNRADGFGGGVLQAGSTMTLRNSVISGNISTEPDVSGAVISNGGNLIGNTTGSTGWAVTDLLNVNPQLAPLGNNGGNTWTHALLPGSPAIDAGSNALAIDPFTGDPLLFDQRGVARIVGGTVDIGASESNFAAGPVTVGGRVTNFTGRGIPNARMTVTNGTTTFVALTNPFGYYQFVDLTPGTTYTLIIKHKSFTFDSPQVFTADQDRNDLTIVPRY